jgi:hypothetical protein
VVLAATKLPTLMAAALKSGKKDKKTLAKNERKMQKAGMQAKFAQGAFVGLLVLSPLLVAPAMYILWVGLPLAPSLVGFLAIGWAAAPDIAIALGGFVAGQPLVAVGSEAPIKGTRTASDGATQSVGRAKKSVAGASDSASSASDSAMSATHSAVSPSDSGGVLSKYPRTCELCPSDSPFAVLKSPNSIGGHMKKHHPEKCDKKDKSLAENLFSKVEPTS